MRYILIFLMLILSFNICFAQKTLKINTKNSSDLNYAELNVPALLVGLPDYKYKLDNNESFIKTFSKLDLEQTWKIQIIVYVKSFDTNGIKICDLLKSMNDLVLHDTLEYNLNVDSISAVLVENHNKKIEGEANKKQDLLERASNLLNDIKEDIDYFTNKINGKSESYIGDLLYDEGFGRRYDTRNSNFCTIYGRIQNYENGDSYTIRIYTWHSYGYGKLFYDITGTIYLKDYGLIVNENKQTKLFDDLVKE